MEYTKGKWEVEDTFRIVDSNGQGVAHSLKPQVFEAKANAYLIASAPDMYEALKSFEDSDIGIGEFIKLKNNALSKAEGK